MHQGVETPWCPIHRRAKILPHFGSDRPRGDYNLYFKATPLRILYIRGVKTPQCPMSGELKNVTCWKSKMVLCTGESWLSGVLCTRELLFVSLNLQGHATAFNATIIQKLFNISINYTNTVYTCLNIFPIPWFLGGLPGVPSTGESF